MGRSIGFRFFDDDVEDIEGAVVEVLPDRVHIESLVKQVAFHGERPVVHSGKVLTENTGNDSRFFRQVLGSFLHCGRQEDGHRHVGGVVGVDIGFLQLAASQKGDCQEKEGYISKCHNTDLLV